MGSSAEERRKVFSRKERKKAPNAWHCYCSLSLSRARRKLLSISGEEKNVAFSLFSSLPISAFFALDNLSSHFRITQFQHVVMGRPLCWITPLFSTYCPIFHTMSLKASKKKQSGVEENPFNGHSHASSLDRPIYSKIDPCP